MRPLDTLRFVSGDTLPQITLQLLDDGGDPVALDDLTITLHVGQSPALVKEAVVVDADAATVCFTFSSGDLVAGDWPAEVQIVSPSGVQTAQMTEQERRFKVSVSEQIA